MTLSQTLPNTFVTVTQGFSTSRQQQQEYVLFNPRRLRVNSFCKLVVTTFWYFCFVMWLCWCDGGLIVLLWYTASSMPVTAQAWWNDGGLSERGPYQRMNLSVLLAITWGSLNLSCWLSVTWGTLTAVLQTAGWYTASAIQLNRFRSHSGLLPSGERLSSRLWDKHLNNLDV